MSHGGVYQQMLVEWFQVSKEREKLAALAEGQIRIEFPDLPPGSDEFYRAVLMRAKG